MSESPSPSEKAISRYEERLEKIVNPTVNRQVAAQGFAVSYAQLATKSVLILNGGALIAYPAFIEATQLKFIISISSILFIFPLALHTAGLLAAIIAVALGYHVMTDEQRFFESVESRERLDLSWRLISEAQQRTLLPNEHLNRKNQITNLNFYMKKNRISSSRKQKSAEILFYLSVFFFLTGALSGLWLISIIGPSHIPDIF